MLKKKTEKLKTEARKLVVPDVFDNMKGLLQPPPHPWETAHLPLPSAYINTYLSLREKCWLKGGVGGQIPRIIS